MSKIINLKKSVNSRNVVILEQNDQGYFMTVNGITTQMADATALNNTYVAYRKAGWIISNPADKKSTTPKADRFIWCKEGKKVWAIQAKIYRDYFRALNPITKETNAKEYWMKEQEYIKAEMKTFEAKMAPIVNPTLTKMIEARNA